MKNEIKYAHTNLIARDWKTLAAFYMDVFNCVPVLPERNLSGEWIDRMTAIPGVRIQGMHLRLPGYTEGPTLEVFAYDPICQRDELPAINRFGFGHIAFHVTDVEDTLTKLLASGGHTYGQPVKTRIEGVGLLQAVYATDPEGNIIEIQHWEKEALL
jgi:predicted enzyme related to lactoylglutathione lyase